MRTTLGFVGLLLILSKPAWAICFGEDIARVCIDEDGQIWTAESGHLQPLSSGSSGSNSGLARYPSASGGSWNSDPAAAPDPNAKTFVPQPSDQGGNAWVLEPQSAGGGAVVQGGGNSGATVCDGTVTC
jgi:hypothetical protein